MKTVKRAPGILRKKQIKAAALAILSEEGMKNLSTKNLAAHVRLSEGAIFRHFHSKNEILFSILEDVENQLVLRLEKIAFRNQPASDRLKEFMCFHLKYLYQNHGVTILLFSEAACQNNSILKNKLHHIFLQIQRYVEKIITDGVVSGVWNTLPPVDALTALYMGIPVSMNIEMYLSGAAFRDKAFCEQIYRMVLHLLASSHKDLTFSEK